MWGINLVTWALHVIELSSVEMLEGKKKERDLQFEVLKDATSFPLEGEKVHHKTRNIDCFNYLVTLTNFRRHTGNS